MTRGEMKSLAADAVKRPRPTRFGIKTGLGVIPVLAVFAITVTVCTVWTKSLLRQQADQRLSEQRVQATWLAEAGVRRGAARWTADGEFTGETWRLPAGEINLPVAASVVIRIAPAPESGSGVRIEAVAAYPADRPRIKVTKTVVFSPPSAESP